MVFSPRQQLKGQCIFLTGGLGYEGSVVLEQLLRLTEVGARGGLTLVASLSSTFSPGSGSKGRTVQGQGDLGMPQQHAEAVTSLQWAMGLLS